MRKNNIKFTCLVIVALSVSIVELGCERVQMGTPKKQQQKKKEKNKYSETKMLMGTIVQMDVCLDQAGMSEIKSAYEDAWKRLKDVSERMSFSGSLSDITKLNHSVREAVSIGEDTYYVLKRSIDFSRSTNGAFDVTVWPLMNLWRKSERNNVVPEKLLIRRVQFAVGFENIQLLGDHRVRLLNRWSKMDLGAIAKGYAVDEAARVFRQHGIECFFIDAGGDVYVGGKNCSGETWRIGIRDPQDGSKIIDVVKVENQAVATSGDYEQYYEIQGQKWSHIINPVTGYPQKGVISASVIAPTALEADALATTLCVLGGVPGTEHINALTDEPRASLIITKPPSGDIKRYESAGYKKYKHTE